MAVIIQPIQNLRALAISAVVLTHVAGEFLAGADGQPHLSLNEVNISFTFVAGFLFRATAFDDSYFQFIRRRAKNILVPYICISLPALVAYVTGMKTHPHLDLSAHQGVTLFIFLLYTGAHLGPLWFVPMIFTLYLCVPLFKLVDRSNLAYLVTIAGGLVLAMGPVVRPQHDAAPIQAAIHYAPVFLLGMACSRNFDALVEFVSLRPGWTAWAFGAAIAFNLMVEDDLNYLAKILLLLAIFLVLSIMSLPAGLERMMTAMATRSFGIFLIHGYLIAMLRIAHDRGLVGGDWALPTCVAVSALVILCCSAILQGAKRVLASRSRLAVGY